MAHTIDGDVIDFAMAPPVSLLFFFYGCGLFRDVSNRGAEEPDLAIG